MSCVVAVQLPLPRGGTRRDAPVLHYKRVGAATSESKRVRFDPAPAAAVAVAVAVTFEPGGQRKPPSRRSDKRPHRAAIAAPEPDLLGTDEVYSAVFRFTECLSVLWSKLLDTLFMHVYDITHELAFRTVAWRNSYGIEEMYLISGFMALHRIKSFNEWRETARRLRAQPAPAAEDHATTLAQEQHKLAYFRRLLAYSAYATISIVRDGDAPSMKRIAKFACLEPIDFLDQSFRFLADIQYDLAWTHNEHVLPHLGAIVLENGGGS